MVPALHPPKRSSKTVGYPYSRGPLDSRIGVPIFCHCQSKGIVNISITWSSRATMQQSTQSENDCSLVFLHNLYRTKLIKLLYYCRAWQDYENDKIMKWLDFEMKLTLGIQTFEIKLNVKQMRTLYTPCEILEIWTRQYRFPILVLIMQYVEHHGKIIKIPYGCPFEGWSKKTSFLAISAVPFQYRP